MAHERAQPAIVDPGQLHLDGEMAALKEELGPDFVAHDAEAAQVFLYHPAEASAPKPRTGPDGQPLPPEPLDYQILFATTISALLSGEIQDATLPVESIRHLTRDEIDALEIRGVNLSGITPDHPHGGLFIKDHFMSRLPGTPTPENSPVSAFSSIAATSFLRGVTRAITHRALTGIPSDISGLPRLAMHSLIAAVYKDRKWSQSHVLPDGEYVAGGFDNGGWQYGQAAFEGLVASDDNGKVTLFRPEENARRFQNSCSAMKMPPISVNQFIASVTAAVQNNKKFIPKNGKLYIRPFMVGLKGGTGIHPAKSYLFAMEVSPYGKYLPTAAGEIDTENELPGGSLKSVIFERTDNGKHKSGGNYGPLMRIKEEAIAEGFNDILLINRKDKIQECSSNNFFLVLRKNKKDKSEKNIFDLYTSSLMSNILPGITRASLIAMLRDPEIQQRLGVTVNVHDDKLVPESLLRRADGIFGTGTAAGISNFRRIKTTRGHEVEFNDQKTQQFIKKLYDLLQDARRGKVPGYEKWAMTVVDKEAA